MKKHKKALFKLVRVERGRKSAETAVASIEKQAEEQHGQLQMAKEQLALAWEEIEIQWKKLGGKEV